MTTRILPNALFSQLADISPELINNIEIYREDSIFDAWELKKKIETVLHSRIYLSQRREY